MKNKIKKKYNIKGVTLIALIITIIILLVLSGVILNMVLGDNKIINKSQIAKENTNYADAKESLQIMLLEIKTRVNTEEKRNTKVTDCNELDGKEEVQKIEYISEETANTEIIMNVENPKYALITYRKYIFKVDKQLVIVEQITADDNKDEIDISKNDSLLGKVSKITQEGMQQIEVNGVVYNANVIIQNENLILDGEKQIDGAILENNKYEFGNKQEDVAKLTEDSNIIQAQNMVILKVNGNLTINENITLTTCKSDDGYGGPKGLFIYVSGILTNNGTIDMTARGAIAQGQNVYLWKNKNGDYEYVPDAGADGGQSISSTYVAVSGDSGNNGINRQTGGGGAGGAYAWAGGAATSGKGGAGTSYSGGSRWRRSIYKRFLCNRTRCSK